MWNIWPFQSKSSKPTGVDVQVYVRDLMVNMEPNDVMLIAMSLANNLSWHWGVEPPDFPHITTRQYQALPERCRTYFVPRSVHLNYIKD